MKPARHSPVLGAALPVVVVWAAALGGCRSPQTPADMVAAEQRERDGTDEEALAAWKKIADACPTPAARPKDECGLAVVRQAQLLERLGREREAAEVWASVPERASSADNAARGLASAARLWAGLLGDPDRALALGWRCVERYPDSLASDDALETVVKIERTRDAKALRDRLDALAARASDTDLVDNVEFAAARVSEEDLHDPIGAVARYDALAARWKRSGLRDDSLWRAAQILRRQGDYRGAAERLRAILRTFKKAWITGSYNSLYLDDARLLLGRILLDDLHDPEGAIAALLELANDGYSKSILRDDALLEVARARLAVHTPPTEADRRLACKALDRLVREFPDGNRVRDAQKQRAVLGCDGR